MTSNDGLSVCNHLASRHDWVVPIVWCCRVRSLPCNFGFELTDCCHEWSFLHTNRFQLEVPGLLWKPIMASTPSSTPSEINARAHLVTSSAGWKIKRTFPCNLSFLLLQHLNGSSKLAVWKSCPHACIAPSFFEA